MELPPDTNDHEQRLETVTATVLGGVGGGGAQCRGTGPIVVCDRVAHSGNIGQIIRLCCNLDARQLYFVQDPRRMFSPRKIVARAAQGRCFWDEGRAGFIEEAALEAALPARRTVIGVETAEGALDVYATELKAASDDHALVLMFGAESTGISPALLALCDFHVLLPCPGPMKSLNVSQCVAVVMCEWFRQSRYVRGEQGAEVPPANPPRAPPVAAAGGHAVVAAAAASDGSAAAGGDDDGATAATVAGVSS